ncbi:MAG: flavodoxin [Eubacterium sp.]|nr:flavodoxin [Eubacterium sp.]
MKTLIVYYSMDGNTKYAAERIKEKIDADLCELVPVKPYANHGPAKYLDGGRSALHKDAPEIYPTNVSTADYDRVIFATPLWAATFAPPLRTFFKAHNLNGKKIALVVCSITGNDAKCFEAMKNEIPAAEVEATLSLKNPKTKRTEANEAALFAFLKKLGA